MNKDATDKSHNTLDTIKTFLTMLKLISGTLVGGASYSDANNNCYVEDEMNSSKHSCNNTTNNNQWKVPTLPKIAQKVARREKRQLDEDWFSSCVVQLCTELSPKKYFKCRTVQYNTISM